MNRIHVLIVASAAVVVAAAASAYSQTTTGTAGRTPAGTAPKRTAAPAAKPTSVRISVKDPQGGNLEGVRLSVSGASTGEYTTGPAGTAVVNDLKPGLYRVRLERDGFVTL